jgi:hypothetical protein
MRMRWRLQLQLKKHKIVQLATKLVSTRAHDAEGGNV